VSEQLIAANVDTLFIVSSLNEDFSLNRIERYLSLANEAQTEPVIVLSKADRCDEVESLRLQVQDLDRLYSATLAEKRARDKNFGKLIKAHLSEKQGRKG
jgi:ribosome biogenesis GTPase